MPLSWTLNDQKGDEITLTSALCQALQQRGQRLKKECMSLLSRRHGRARMEYRFWLCVYFLSLMTICPDVFWLKLYVQISSQCHWRSEDSSVSQGVLTMGTAGLRCWAHVHMSRQPRLNLRNGGQGFLPGLALWCPNTGSKCSKLEKWVKMDQATLNRNR